MDSISIVKNAAIALDNKKARDLKILKIDDLTVLSEYFVIATATSSTHVRALADEVEDTLKNLGCDPHHIEGRSTGWIVLDYSSVIVHIFTPDQREFYGLDRMWSDAKPIDATEILDAVVED